MGRQVTTAELRAFFDACELPTAPVALCPGSTIIDARAFVTSHLSALADKAGPTRNRALFYQRLLTFYYIVNNDTNRTTAGRTGASE